MGYSGDYEDYKARELKAHTHNRSQSRHQSNTASPAPSYGRPRAVSTAYRPPPAPLLTVARRNLRRAPLVSLLLLAVLAVYVYDPFGTLAVPGWVCSERSTCPDREWRSLSDVHNDTLGFERIFVINLARRTDKRDSMTLAAAMTGMRLEYIDAVNGSSVAEGQVPNPDPEQELNMIKGQIGCWRSHLNILEKIVAEGISSALIMEDDADWDLRLKSQLSQFALATRILSQPRAHSFGAYVDPTYPLPSSDDEPALEVDIRRAPSTVAPRLSPYGDAWDVLWLGHCGTRFPTHANDPRSSRGRVLAYDDPTVPEPHYWEQEWGSDDLVTSRYPNHTRVFHHTSKNVCTLAYAVSQAGARRILYDAGVVKTDRPIDLMLRAYCDGEGERRGGRACFTTQPQYFQHYRPRGSAKKFSDISNHSDVYNARDGTFNVRLSTRMNLEKMLEGEEDYLDQFPDTA